MDWKSKAVNRRKDQYHIVWISEPSNKGATIVLTRTLNTINSRYRTDVASFFLLEQEITSVPYGQTFKHFNPFFETLDERMEQIIATKTDNFEQKQQKVSRKMKRKHEPQVLTMEHLELGFIACLISLTFASITFAVEILTPKFRSLTHALIATSVAKTFFRFYSQRL